MWLDDLREAMEVIDPRYFYTACFTRIYPSGDKIIFEASTFKLVYSVKTGSYYSTSIN